MSRRWATRGERRDDKGSAARGERRDDKGSAARGERCDDKGSATAELAVALPAIVILLVTGILAIAAVTAKLGCVATAHEAAIEASRGQALSNAEGVTVETAADIVRVTVVRGAITCVAVAAREPGQP